MHKVVLIPGDGIGPEVSAAAKRIIDATGVQIEWILKEAGEHVLLETGELIPESVIDAIKEYRVALKGPITTPIGRGFKSVNVTLRQQFDLYANIRPVMSYGDLTKFLGVDLVIFRENTEDLYIGKEVVISGGEVHAIKIITKKASLRIAKKAFDYALKHKRRKVTAVHKANIMKLSDGLFLECCREVAEQYPMIGYEEMIVDNMCMQLVMYPQKYDVLVTENLYGDILSDLASGLVGGLGLVPGANIGEDLAIFEAVHGSAPDIAGLSIANPIAMTLSGAMMLDYLGEPKRADAIRSAVEKTLKDKSLLTPDLGGQGSLKSITDGIIKNMILD
ncbi:MULTISPECIES: isocitrate/isopropylmalate dehydrogenase family protein [unclassified Fusibacter]|uniref:isocitrate/isopropylmalate dehydrogenase family protein n=1 Tax=unclassified Fusibacter TaxID=2624464 RepID=UPI00101332B1|nr:MULTISPECIES: isocitrate/isopropylmalate dehydrogenase family protein [unclassified Fusibacter]MCK8059109.1 isocitrate/isopropylmalate dehydrogenase family protein [Fusibacter sp. A2]NPE22518.1 isocitrate/isopropylmalate dehydrogenase family protein [Fusibacter sp. A1]RXV60621.1 isocitrate/isopropylmalate dehydrogenase family protein [Fusibacter sp. A1]